MTVDAVVPGVDLERAVRVVDSFRTTADRHGGIGHEPGNPDDGVCARERAQRAGPHPLGALDMEMDEVFCTGPPSDERSRQRIARMLGSLDDLDTVLLRIADQTG